MMNNLLSLLASIALVSGARVARDNGYAKIGQAYRLAHKLSATKIKLSHWSTGHSIHLGLADKSQMNL